MINFFRKSVSLSSGKRALVGAVVAGSFFVTAIAYACSITVVVNTVGGTQASSNFTVNVTGDNNPNPSTFPGSASGTDVTFSGEGNFQVNVASSTNYTTSYSSDCFGHILTTDHLMCTVTNTYQTPVIPSADLGITKTANVTSTVEGGTINYTLTVRALGPATSTGVVATDTLPTTLTFVN
ncbi:MAG TPA: hypothetical protein VHZ04_02850, partial [Candidatus Paceibacterota bacterium]|nr:hypothetical protein [Candidatus Paceibacterota bacterium]